MPHQSWKELATINVVPIREFLRGGYRKLQGPTVVSSHGRPIFTVLPYAPRSSLMTVPLAAVMEGATDGELSTEAPEEGPGSGMLDVHP